MTSTNDPDIDYSAAMFNGGVPLIDGLHGTGSVRCTPEADREVMLSGPDYWASYHDALELFQQVALACEMADPVGFREVLATLPRYGADRKATS